MVARPGKGFDICLKQNICRCIPYACTCDLISVEILCHYNHHSIGPFVTILYLSSQQWGHADIGVIPPKSVLMDCQFQ